MRSIHLIGAFGVHNFYAGNTGKGVGQLVLTFFLCGLGGSIWALVDLIMICTDKFTDGQGRIIC